MRCQFCGTENNPEAKFCDECGKSLEKAKKTFSNDDSVLVLKPQFLKEPTLIAASVISLFIAGVLGAIAGVVTNLVMLDDPFEPFKALPFILWILGLYVLFVSIIYFGVRKSRLNTEYKLFSDRVEITSGVFAVNMKVVSLKFINQVNLRIGAFQRKHGFGTTLLSSIGTLAGTTGGFHGVALTNIENPEKYYNILKNLFEENK